MTTSTDPGGDAPTCGELLVQYLALEGVTHVFGVPGSANAHTLQALGRSTQTPGEAGVQFVVCRHETGAAYMADGYARVSGGLATVLVTSGPGALNALTGAVNANESRTPMLVLSGEVPQQYYGKAFLQEGIDADLDIDGVYANAGRYSAVVSTPTNFTQLLTQALREARSLPGALAHLSLPDDVMASPAPAGSSLPTSSTSYRVQPTGADLAMMTAIFDGLTTEDYPLVMLGDGARRALRDPARRAGFIELIERLALPVMTSPDGKGIFPESHELSLRTYGLAQCEWPQYYLRPSLLDPARPAQFGALLVLGSELGELATMIPSGDPSAVHYTKDIVPTGMFAHIDENQSVIGREYAITHGMVAEAGRAIDQLIELGAASPAAPPSADGRRAFIAEIKASRSPYRAPAARISPDSPISPPALLTLMQRALHARPEPADIWVDAGNCVGWCMQYLEVDPPTEIHSALAMGPMGFAIGAAVGGKLAAPSRTSVAVVGDGAFLMHGNEISTAAAHQVGAVFVVLFDNRLNMVVQGMEGMFPGQASWDSLYSLGNPDLAMFARSLGADSYDVSSPADAAEAFAAAFTLAEQNGTPQVIVAHIDVTAVPPYYAPTAG